MFTWKIIKKTIPCKTLAIWKGFAFCYSEVFSLENMQTQDIQKSTRWGKKKERKSQDKTGKVIITSMKDEKEQELNIENGWTQFSFSP